MLPDLLAALAPGRAPRGSRPVLVAVEGIGAEEAADQAARLAAAAAPKATPSSALEGRGGRTASAGRPLAGGVACPGRAARRWRWAAILADQVESRWSAAALSSGCAGRRRPFLAVPFAQFGVAMEAWLLGELRASAVWATGTMLRPDVSVLLRPRPQRRRPPAASGAGG
jgi:hypothetical protein